MCTVHIGLFLPNVFLFLPFTPASYLVRVKFVLTQLFCSSIIKRKYLNDDGIKGAKIKWSE